MARGFSKRVKIAPGIKLNISSKGVSTTIGPKGASVNIGKSGTYVNTGIPGTGISKRTKISGAKTTREPETQAKSSGGWATFAVVFIAIGIVGYFLS